MSSEKPFIPLDDLYADDGKYAILRDTHHRNMVIMQSTSATVSVIASCLLISMILRSPKRLTITYHKLLLGMSISDILFSMTQMHFNALAPSDMSYSAWNAKGSQATCTGVGFLMVIGWASTLLYTCSLNGYYLMVVKYNKSDEYIRGKVEPFLHGVPIVFALVVAITLIVNENINSALDGTCLEPVYEPPHCRGVEDGTVREGFDIPCGRGRQGAVSFFYAIFFILTFITPLFIIVTLTTMFESVRRVERRSARYAGASSEQCQQLPVATGDENLRGNRTSGIRNMARMVRGLAAPARGNNTSNRARRNHSRVVIQRALAYSVAYFASWTWFTIYVALQVAGVKTPLAIIYLANLLNPLQGFFNFIIFWIHPKVMNARTSHNISWCQAIGIVISPSSQCSVCWRFGVCRRREVPSSQTLDKKQVEGSKGKQDSTVKETSAVPHVNEGNAVVGIEENVGDQINEI